MAYLPNAITSSSSLASGDGSADTSIYDVDDFQRQDDVRDSDTDPARWG